MRLIMLGANHRTAAIELRECLALAPDASERLISSIRTRYPGAEVVVLSTCNRTELYIARPSHEPPTVDDLRGLLAQFTGAAISELTASTIHRENEQALSHLFRVTTGLDSMVLGETEIIGQVRRAYDQACQRQSVGFFLHKTFQEALTIARRIRAATGIDTGRLSVGSTAVDFARQVFDHFGDKVVLGIGAGEMGKVTLRHMQALAPHRLWLTNRTRQRADAVAAALDLDPNHGGVRDFEQLDELLTEADIVITSTGAKQPIITAERFRSIMRRRHNRPLVIIDIAVPRDVEAAVGGLSNIYLYDLDDLQRVVEHTRSERAEQVDQCEAQIREAVKVCMNQLRTRDIGVLVRELRQRLHTIGELEHVRTCNRLRDADPQQIDQILEQHNHRLINKILAMPLAALDQRDADAPLGFYAAALRRLFALDTPPTTAADEDADAQPTSTTKAH